MHYTLHQLQIFLSIVEHSSITKAAESLHLTQPAVSIQYRKLQDQFDIPLLEVIGRKLHITDFGLEIATMAQTIINEVEAIERHTLALKGLLTGKLKLSIVSTGKYIMPFFLSSFLKEHPSVELDMDVTNKSSVVGHLEQNTVDFALVSVMPPNMALNSEVLMQNQLFLVGKKTKKLDESESLENVPLIFREQGSATKEAMERFLKKENINAKKTITLTSNEAVKQAVLAGLGWSIMPIIGILNELKNNSLQIIEHEQLPITTNWNLVWLKEKKLSPIASKFLDHLRATKEESMKQFER